MIIGTARPPQALTSSWSGDLIAKGTTLPFLPSRKHFSHCLTAPEFILWSSVLKMETAYSSQRNNPEEYNINSYRREKI